MIVSPRSEAIATRSKFFREIDSDWEVVDLLRDVSVPRRICVADEHADARDTVADALRNANHTRQREQRRPMEFDHAFDSRRAHA